MVPHWRQSRQWEFSNLCMYVHVYEMNVNSTVTIKHKLHWCGKKRLDTIFKIKFYCEVFKFNACKLKSIW